MKRLVSTARVLLLISFSFCFSFAKASSDKVARELLATTEYEKQVNVFASQRVDAALKSGKLPAKLDRSKFVNELRKKFSDIAINKLVTNMTEVEMKESTKYLSSPANKKFQAEMQGFIAYINNPLNTKVRNALGEIKPADFDKAFDEAAAVAPVSKK